jgi:hypothetical protein
MRFWGCLNENVLRRKFERAGVDSESIPVGPNGPTALNLPCEVC